jgi:hypothetical protein
MEIYNWNKKMPGVTESQRSILENLIYIESWDHIRQETSLSPGVIRDDLITLAHYNMIEIFDGPDGKAGRKLRHFDNDHPERFYYRATKSGLNAVKLHQ